MLLKENEDEKSRLIIRCVSIAKSSETSGAGGGT